MKTPKRLQPLVDEGVIDSVVRQLMSGKEAMVFVVRAGADTRCAKVYKEADQRSFRQAVDYTENRKTKNSRQARAMAKGTRYGRQSQERAWRNAEVDALRRLAVPTLVAYGARSPETMVKIVQAIAALVPGARLERIEDANHALTTTHADLVAAMIGTLADRSS